MTDQKEEVIVNSDICPVCKLSMPPFNKFCSINCHDFLKEGKRENEWMAQVYKQVRWDGTNVERAVSWRD